MPRAKVVCLLAITIAIACGPGRLTFTGPGESVSTEGEGEGEGEAEGEAEGWDPEDEDEGWEAEAEAEAESETDDGNDDDPGAHDGATCVGDRECASQNCYVIPFIGGSCGECNSDDDCPDGGCTAPNIFATTPSACNVGELGGGCESDEVCMLGLTCATSLMLFDVITLSTCSECALDMHCFGGQICAPLVELQDYAGFMACIDPGTLEQDSYCHFESNGDLACASGICSIVDIMGLAQMGACGECQSNADCNGGTCIPGELNLDTAALTGSICISP